MAVLLDVSVSYLLGETREADPLWSESYANWRAWLRDTNGLDADISMEVLEQWQQSYKRNTQKPSAISFRDNRTPTTAAEWDKYKQIHKKRALQVTHNRGFSERHASELIRRFVERSGDAGGDPIEAICGHVTRLRNALSVGTRDSELEAFMRARRIDRPESVADLHCDGYLEPKGTAFNDGFRMVLKASSNKARIKFTTAHEICHSVFYEMVPELKFSAQRTDPYEERL
jgi:hypothetical protein